MRDSDDDKTKIKRVVNQPAVNKHAESEQATRIVPAKNKITAASHNEDKTRITGHSQQQTPADDKTRILGNTSKYNTKSSSKEIVSDRTRFRAANVAPGNDKAATVNEITGGPEVQPVQIEESEHVTLKNRFILEKVLGVGGMGIVYKAKDRLKVEAQDRDPYVAIKVLSEEFKTHPEAFISLQRESRKSQRIAHPNIVNAQCQPVPIDIDLGETESKGEHLAVILRIGRRGAHISVLRRAPGAGYDVVDAIVQAAFIVVIMPIENKLDAGFDKLSMQVTQHVLIGTVAVRARGKRRHMVGRENMSYFRIVLGILKLPGYPNVLLGCSVSDLSVIQYQKQGVGVLECKIQGIVTHAR